MRLLGLLALACGAASAQVSPMSTAVMQSMHRVCSVDRDSRQCEVLQDLFADQAAIDQGRAPAMRPVVPPEEKAVLRKTITQDQPRIDDAGLRLVEALTMKQYKAERGYITR